jgi:peroxiredoxin Q/BCP
MGAKVLGVSPNPVDTLKRFRDANDVPFPFASDATTAVSKAYDVRRRIPLLPTRRVTFVIDRTGMIQGAYHHELAIGRHVGDVLDCVAKLEAAGAGELVCV